MVKPNNFHKIIRLKVISFTLILCLMGIAPSALRAENLSPVGLWKTVSDKTGKALSFFKITVENGELSGKIEKLILGPGEDPNPLCTKCSGEKKDNPIQGMTVLWGLTEDGDEWNGGYILDPDNGETYRCLVRVVEDGEKLEVRGYIGFSLFGRTQIWLKAD